MQIILNLVPKNDINQDKESLSVEFRATLNVYAVGYLGRNK